MLRQANIQTPPFEKTSPILIFSSLAFKWLIEFTTKILYAFSASSLSSNIIDFFILLLDVFTLQFLFL